MSVESAKTVVLEFGMGVDVHGHDSTKAARRAVLDAIRHASLPLVDEVRQAGGSMLVEVNIGVPDPSTVSIEAVKAELPHGEVTVHAVSGGLSVAETDSVIACASIKVSMQNPSGVH